MATVITKKRTSELVRTATGRSYFEHGRSITFRCPACEKDILADRYSAEPVRALIKSFLTAHLSWGDCSEFPWLYSDGTQ